MDTEIRTIWSDSNILDVCPAFLDDLTQCGQILQLFHDAHLIGDDYGSWTIHHIYFKCGHTVEQMKSGVENKDLV